MAYQPTDNTPRQNFGVHHIEEVPVPGLNNLEIGGPPQAQDIPDERPDSQDGFASMIAETLRGLTSEQRLYAQQEIIKVLNHARFVGTQPHNSREMNNIGESSSGMAEIGAQPAHSLHTQYDPASSGFHYDRYGIAYSPPRGTPERNVNDDVAPNEDSSDLEWGFTPDNSLSP